MAGDRAPGSPLRQGEAADFEERTRGSEEEVRELMRRQLWLSTIAAVFLFGSVFGAVMVMYLAPDLLAKASWHGFRLDFLFAAVLVYPVTWVVVTVYTLVANRLDGLR